MSSAYIRGFILRSDPPRWPSTKDVKCRHDTSPQHSGSSPPWHGTPPAICQALSLAQPGNNLLSADDLPSCSKYSNITVVSRLHVRCAWSTGLHISFTHTVGKANDVFHSFLVLDPCRHGISTSRSFTPSAPGNIPTRRDAVHAMFSQPSWNHVVAVTDIIFILLPLKHTPRHAVLAKVPKMALQDERGDNHFVPSRTMPQSS